MNDKPVHFLDTLSEKDWHLIANALYKMGTPRSKELSQDFLSWRAQVARSHAAFLQALRDLRA